MVATRSRRSISAIKPFPIYQKQSDFLQSRAFVKGFAAGRGAGKTVIGAFEILQRARNSESWMVVSPDNSVVSETTWPTFIEVAKQTGQWIRGIKSPYHRATFWSLDGGKAEATFRSGDVPDKLRGPSKAGIWLDEASVMLRDVFDISIGVLRHKGKMGQCLMTFTPRGRRHWTFTEFYEPVLERELSGLTQKQIDAFPCFGGSLFRMRGNRELIHATSLENPFLPVEYVDNIRSAYTEVFAAQELFGQFVDIEGLLFSRSKFHFIAPNAVPRDCLRVRYWDQASLPGAGCFTVGLLMARDLRNRYFVEDVVRGQWSPHDRRERMLETAKRDAELYGNEVIIYIEQEGGSGGVEQMNQNIIDLAGFPVYRDVVSGVQYQNKQNLRLPGKAKVIRAMGVAAQVEAGNVYLVDGARWVQSFLDEAISFPESTYMDQVDAFSGAFNKLAGRGRVDIGPPEHVEAHDHTIGARILEMQRQLRRGR